MKRIKQFFFLFLLCSLSISCRQPVPAYESSVKAENFRMSYDSKQTDLYYLKNKKGVQIAVTNFGARVVELVVPDRNGVLADVVLGHDHLDKYINYKGERFLGAAIGRVGNRIARGRFTIDSVQYQSDINNAPNTLHGGVRGFDMVVWDAEQVGDSLIRFKYVSPDMEGGFPGTLSVEMDYSLDDNNEFKIAYRATTDKATPVNLTHHSFFNLAGESESTINDHLLTINASHYTPVDTTLIPLGTIDPVEGTPMDFRVATAVGLRLNQDFDQFRYAGGYDHNWVLDRKTDNEVEFAARLVEPVSGRTLEVWTTEPAMQFYGGNFFDGTMPSKNGGTYKYRASLALETQHFPDSPNQPAFPSVILNPGECYRQVCIYKFGVTD